MELEQGQSTRLRLGFAGPVSMTLRGFSDQMDAAETSGSESAAPQPTRYRVRAGRRD